MDLKKHLAIANKLVGNSPVIPIIENMLLTKGKAEITNLEADFSFPIDGDIVEPMLIGFSKFYRIAKSLKFDFTLKFKEDGISLESKKGEFFIEKSELDIEDFPSVENALDVSSKDVFMKTQRIDKFRADSIRQCLPFLSKDDLRPAITGVFVGERHIVATNAHIMKFIECENTVQTIIPPSIASLIEERADLNQYFIGKSSQSVCEVEFDDKSRLVYTPIDSKYHHYESVIPENNPFCLRVDKKQFIETVDSCIMYFDKKEQLKTGGKFPIKIAVIEGQIKVQTNPDKDVSPNAIDFTSLLMGRVESGDMNAFGFDAEKLIVALKSIQDNELVFVGSKPSRAFVINGDTLVMPIMIK